MLELVPSLTMEDVKPLMRTCASGKKSRHPLCAAYLGLQHVVAALASQASCQHCTRLSIKTSQRRLAHQASLSTADPMMGVNSTQSVSPLTSPHAGTKTNNVEQLTPIIAESHSRTRSTEPTDRPAVQGPPSLQGLKTQQCGGSDLGEIRPSKGGSPMLRWGWMPWRMSGLVFSCMLFPH